MIVDKVHIFMSPNERTHIHSSVHTEGSGTAYLSRQHACMVFALRWTILCPRYIPTSFSVDWIPGDRAILAAIEGVEGLHILSTYLEIVHLRIRDDAIGVGGFRERHKATNERNLDFPRHTH